MLRRIDHIMRHLLLLLVACSPIEPRSATIIVEARHPTIPLDSVYLDGTQRLTAPLLQKRLKIHTTEGCHELRAVWTADTKRANTRTLCPTARDPKMVVYE